MMRFDVDILKSGDKETRTLPFNQFNKKLGIFFVFIFLFIVCFGAYLFLPYFKCARQTKVINNMEIAALKKKTQEVLKKRETLQKVTGMLKKFQEESIEFGDKLRDLYRIVPDNFCLSGIEFADFKEKRSVKRSGSSLSKKSLIIEGFLPFSKTSLNSVTNFMDSLASCPTISSDFKYPTLISYFRSKNDQSSVTFKLFLERK